MRSPPQRKGPVEGGPPQRPIPDRSRRRVARSAVGSSQLRSLPGSSFEDIFSAQPEPTLDEALRDPALRAEYVDPYGELVDEPADAQPSIEPTRASATRERRCRNCSASVYWVTTERNRKQLPLDPVPSTDTSAGNFVIVEVGGKRLARYVSDERRRALIEGGNYVWVSHFATCEGRRRMR